MKRFLLKWIATMVAPIMIGGAAVTSCTDDSQTEGESTQLLQQIVTFTGNADNGRVGFEYRAVDDSPLVTLWSPGQINERDAKAGDRLLLTYRLSPERDPAEGGEVYVSGLQRVLTDTVSVAAPAEEPGPLYLLTIQRSGEYLDLSAMMPQTTGRKIAITASTDAADAEGIVSLTIDASEGKEPEKTYLAQAWASLWIGPVWSRPEVKGVRVSVNNSNNPYRTEFTFYKQS